MRFLFLVLSISVLFFCETARAASNRAMIKVKFVQPQTSNIISGTVEVRVRFTPDPGARMPAQAMVGVGGAPWARMSRAQSGDDWVAVVDTTLVPNGPQKVMVVSDQRYGRGAIDVTVTNGLKCFFADMHGHSSYSDGTMTPQTAHDYARNISKLDIFSLTDHLESLTDDEWADMREQADKANQDGAFVTLAGLEWTKGQRGHACILDPKTRFWPANIEAFYQAAADAGVIVKFNHPGSGTTVFNGLAYSEVGDQAVELMEVRSEQEELAYIRALNLGWHLGPDGSDDTHVSIWGSRAWTGIWTSGLSRRNVWEALKARRCFSTLDRNCRLLFTANGAPMGTIMKEPVDSLAITVNVEDPDSDDTITKIALYQDGKVAATTEPGTATAQWSTKVSVQPGSHYWFVKATQADTNAVWSAPIWATGRSHK